MSRFAQFSVKDMGDQALSSVDVAAVLGIVEYAEHPFGKGALTRNGVQYSAEALAATATTDQPVESVTIDPLAVGSAIEYEFGLTAAFKATSSTTCTIGYQWKARNKGGTWVNLHAASAIAAAVGTTYAHEPTWSGRFKATTNLNRVPFDVQLDFRCSTSTEGYAKIKNSSYAKVIYTAD